MGMILYEDDDVGLCVTCAWQQVSHGSWWWMIIW